MAIFIKHTLIAICLLFSFSVVGHTIYAPNDIPLLDNRFRIDPKTEQITFIFNHSKGYQRVVLVQPDGSKLYQQRHPENVAWLNGETTDIVTVQNPMPGPWQAIAELDGDNRIKLISDVQLKTNRLPLKLYAKEYISTEASLYDDGKLMKNPAYIVDTKLTVSLVGEANKKLALYLDDGKNYDQVAFDGSLTAQLFVDLKPGRYLMSIRTKNDVFIRNVNKDAVVFPSPISYSIDPVESGSDEAIITFTVDPAEIDPNSVSIDGVIKDIEHKLISQVMVHNTDNEPGTKSFTSQYKLAHEMYTFSGKAYATTQEGREIELQLPERFFELVAPYVAPVINESAALSTDINQETAIEEAAPSSIFSNLWVIVAISVTVLLIIVAIVFLIIRRKKKKLALLDASENELNLDELQPMPIDVTDGK